MTRKAKSPYMKGRICAGCAEFFDEVRPLPPIAQGICCEPKSDHFNHFLHPQHPACEHRSLEKKR